MAGIQNKKRLVSILLIVTFSWIVYFSALPVRSAGNYSTGVFEKENADKPVFKKKSIPPWILIGAGVIGAGIVACLLFSTQNSKEKMREDFNGKADSKWQPRHPSSWTVANGLYSYIGFNFESEEYNFYNREWSKPNYTLTVKTRSGGFYWYILRINLICSTTPNNVSGYMFGFYTTGEGSYSVSSLNGYDFTNFNFKGKWTIIKDWTKSSAILGDHNWDVFKIVRRGNTYSLYINDQPVFTFSDDAYDPRYVCLSIFSTADFSVYAKFDYVYLDVED